MTPFNLPNLRQTMADNILKSVGNKVMLEGKSAANSH